MELKTMIRKPHCCCVYLYCKWGRAGAYCLQAAAVSRALAAERRCTKLVNGYKQKLT
jgi:hypothetical protein